MIETSMVIKDPINVWSWFEVNNLATQEEIIAAHPFLYHMTEAEAWGSIQCHGLLSTKALLELFEVDEERRTAIGSDYRKRREVIQHANHGEATIREQTPMPPRKLDLALTDMNHTEWYQLVNGKVFFWSTEDRLMKFLGAKANHNRPHDVLKVCTRSLVEQPEATIKLSHMNSGTVRDIRHKRGSHTFQTIADYRCTKRTECFAELAVDGCVSNIEQHTLSVDRWIGKNRQKNLWQR